MACGTAVRKGMVATAGQTPRPCVGKVDMSVVHTGVQPGHWLGGPVGGEGSDFPTPCLVCTANLSGEPWEKGMASPRLANIRRGTRTYPPGLWGGGAEVPEKSQGLRGPRIQALAGVLEDFVG